MDERERQRLLVLCGVELSYQSRWLWHGVYSFFNVGPNIIEDSAITVPNVAGVTIHDAVTVWLGGYGQITHIVDNAGTTASSAVGAHPQDLVKYGGVACTTNCAPAAPTGVTAVAVSGSQINLSWTASTTAGVTYSVYRSTASGFTPAAANKIASVASGTTYADTGLTVGTTYFYVVEATNAAGNSSASNQASATTQSGVAVPAPPTNVIATAISASQINLTWTASTTAGVYYEIFASTTPGFMPSEGTLLASTGGTSYSHTGLAASTTYYYAVEAVLSTVSAAARASATTQSGGGATVIAIDAGSTTPVGNFSADTDFTGGSIYAPGEAVTVPGTLTNAAPAAVYQTAREGDFTYTIPGS